MQHRCTSASSGGIPAVRYQTLSLGYLVGDGARLAAIFTSLIPSPVSEIA